MGIGKCISSFNCVFCHAWKGLAFICRQHEHKTLLALDTSISIGSLGEWLNIDMGCIVYTTIFVSSPSVGFVVSATKHPSLGERTFGTCSSLEPTLLYSEYFAFSMGCLVEQRANIV